MVEDFEYRGEWWVPEKPEKRVSGTLKFMPMRGAVLELLGSFKGTEELNEMQSPPVILGSSANGKNITLYECFETKFKMNLPGFFESTYMVHIVFIGCHFASFENIKFKTVSVRYLFLDEWVSLQGFDIQYLHAEKRIEIKYKLPGPIQVTLNNQDKIRIEFVAKPPSRSMVQKEASIKQETYLVIEPSSEKHIEELLEIHYTFQKFLTLACLEPVYPLYMKGTTESSKRQVRDGVFYDPVEIFFQLPDGAFPHISKELLPPDMLFTLRTISGQFSEAVKNWFDKQETHNLVYDSYFVTLYNPRMYLPHRFLSLVRGLETYHRRAIGNEELPSDKHGKRIEEIMVSTRDIYRNWLKDKLQYSNEPSLRKRLREIVRDMTEEIEYTNKFIDDKKSFIDKVVNTRHYLTHCDPRLKEKAVEGEELFYITQKLKILIEACLLKEIGFKKEEINSMFSESGKYQRMFISRQRKGRLFEVQTIKEKG